MDSLRHPLAFLLLLVSGWVHRQQQAVIDYLLEENRILRAAHASRRVRLTDDQRRRLAVKGVVLGRRRLADVSGIATPDTILRWYRRLVAQKYDGSHARRPVVCENSAHATATPRLAVDPRQNSSRLTQQIRISGPSPGTDGNPLPESLRVDGELRSLKTDLPEAPGRRRSNGANIRRRANQRLHFSTRCSRPYSVRTGQNPAIFARCRAQGRRLRRRRRSNCSQPPPAGKSVAVSC